MMKCCNIVISYIYIIVYKEINVLLCYLHNRNYPNVRDSVSLKKIKKLF